MPIEVTDARSNSNDQIAYAARVIGNSAIRQKIFSAICKGKKKVKTISEIVEKTGFPRKRVLEEAIKLHNLEVLRQAKDKVDGDLAYVKDSFYCQKTRQILSLATNRAQLKAFPTKVNPKSSNAIIKISFPRQMINANQITIGDIDSFAKVRQIRLSANQSPPIYEKKFKAGLQRILVESGKFQDWGGEINDLNAKVRINGKRVSAAFALKGRGTKGVLTPNKMGKRGDQIQRLFRSPADIFFVQYWGQIDESVVEQMEQLAMAKSAAEGRKILYGVINGQDSSRLYLAYKKCF